MIRHPFHRVALASIAFAVVAGCSPAANVKHDAASARADQARTDRDRAATQVRRKADMEQVAARARGAAADDIARSDAHQAQRAAETATGENRQR